MQTKEDVAVALGIATKYLQFVLYGSEDRKKYHSFEIPKRSGGSRTISAPPYRLLRLQQLAYLKLVDLYTPKPCVHGFSKGRSVVSNAEIHKRQRHLVNFDLKDFFPAIHFGRVQGVFLAEPFLCGKEAAIVLAQICCRDDGELPQGGAMSPFIANLICRSLDNDLVAFAKKHKLRYSRYADDLTFSTSRLKLPSQLIDTFTQPPTPGNELITLIEEHGFKINPKKVKYRSKYRRQEVTGLTVNAFPNVTRNFIRRISGALHAWESHGYPAAQETYESNYNGSGGVHLNNVIRGQLAYVGMVRGKNDYLFRRLARRFNRLATTPIKLCSLSSLPPCKMRNNASNDWNTWIEKYKSEIFHLLFVKEHGDKGSGTAFHIGGGIFATAKHNIINDKGDLYNDFKVSTDSKEIEVQPLHIPELLNNYRDDKDIALLTMDSLSTSRGIPTQLRLPELGESVAAIGFPAIPWRRPTMVVHAGVVEALPTHFNKNMRYIQVSFQSGGGLSGGCLIDKSGHVLGILIENVFMQQSDPSSENDHGIKAPGRAYGQAIPMEYLDDILHLGSSAIPK